MTKHNEIVTQNVTRKEITKRTSMKCGYDPTTL